MHLIGRHPPLRVLPAIDVLSLCGQHKHQTQEGQNYYSSVHRILLQVDQPLDGQQLRERGRHLGQREAGVMRAVRLPLERERPVHRVAELVRERYDVAEVVGVVHEDVREHGLRDRGAVRAADLAGARLCVDVRTVETAAEDVADPPDRETNDQEADYGGHHRLAEPVGRGFS